MQFAAAASSALRTVLAGPGQPARLLGVSPAAVYLAVAGQPGVLAVLAHDAVRLPCGLLLPATSGELPLTAIGPALGTGCTVGDGWVRWPGANGPVTIQAVREWAPAQVRRGAPAADAVQQARAALTDAPLMGIDADLLMLLRAPGSGPADAGSRSGRGPRLTPPASTGPLVAGLLGRGPGLTPAGDDVLAGLLLGCLAFGLDAAALRGAIAALAPERTTALSAALLRHAARGQCIPEVAALAAALTGSGQVGPAAGRLLAVGHSSGAALALGLILAVGAG